MTGFEDIAGAIMGGQVQGSTPAPTPLLAQNLWSGGGPGDPVLGKGEKDLISKLLGSKMKFDDRTAREVIDSVSKKSGLPSDFLAASALQEGMNKSISDPDAVSEAYIKAGIGNDFPIDGFYNYGLDTFTDAFPRLVKKGYLPQDFTYKPYQAFNEKDNLVNTAAFKNNEDALYAKAAYLRDMMDGVKQSAQKKGVKLNDRELQYFTMAAYNGGPGAANEMLDEMLEQKKDAAGYIKSGSVKKSKVHKNIVPRMQKMEYLKTLFTK